MEDNNKQKHNNESNSFVISSSNKYKNNKKWQQQQQQQQKLKQLKPAANGEEIFANVEKIAMKSNSPTTAAKTKLIQLQQQQHRLTVAASTADLKIVSGIINPTTDVASAALVAASVGNNNRVAFVPSATQQRSRRDAPSCVVNYKAQRQLWIGCTAPNLIDVRPQCNDDGDEEYSCHGSWSENGTVYIIARHKGSKHGVCISYRPLEGTAAQLVIGDACYRAATLPPEHPLVANLTVFGKCGDTSAARPSLHAAAPTNWWMTLAMSTAAMLLTYIIGQTHTRTLALTQTHTQTTR